MAIINKGPCVFNSDLLFTLISLQKNHSAAFINIFNNTFVIYHSSTKILLHIPNKLSYWRAKTYSTKEPETLEWIDDMQHGKTLWDIGANIGLYSIYGALKKGLKVYSFEPSVFNLELLARNIYTNKVVDNCCIVPLALNNKISSSNLNMTSTEWGGGFIYI